MHGALNRHFRGLEAPLQFRVRGTLPTGLPRPAQPFAAEDRPDLMIPVVAGTLQCEISYTTFEVKAIWQNRHWLSTGKMNSGLGKMGGLPLAIRHQSGSARFGA